ncbi:MAG: GxxExxY protein [Opitutae bacterium]|nr:GxxExxY protein [Opitutae bacterium]
MRPDQANSVGLHVYHGHGYLEKVYENALAHRLKKAGFKVEQQVPLQVFDEDGTLIGDYFADLRVEGEIIVELKAAKTIAPEHEAQMLGYLKSARKRHGPLVNFGAYKFEIRKHAGKSENQKSPHRTPRAHGFGWDLCGLCVLGGQRLF